MGENLKDLLAEMLTLAERAETCALREALQSNGNERNEALSSYNQLSYCRAAIGNIVNPPVAEKAAGEQRDAFLGPMAQPHFRRNY